MVAVLLSRELGTRLVLNERPEHGLLALEFTTLILGIYPVEDGTLLVHGECGGSGGKDAKRCRWIGDVG